MSPHDIVRDLNAQPFKPFRIHMVSGKTYDIRHPDLVAVTGTALVIFTFLSESEGIFDRWETSFVVADRTNYVSRCRVRLAEFNV